MNIAMRTSPAQTRKRVALGMSGGVDSSVCAHLLVEQGYEVTGVYLECWRAPGCRTEEDRKDALKVALDLGIPFQVLDFKEAYRNRVVEYFFAEYEAGRTPNPDVMCNKEIKFGLFYDWAIEQGFDFVATGHYAQVGHVTNSDGEVVQAELKIPTDTHKDQTYFLYRMTEEQLQHTLFPLGGLTKPEVRAEAEKRNLHVATKKDSVGICFIGDINVHEFLKERLGEKPGEVIDVHGNVIGKHTGLWFYTVGQRHGFEIDKKTFVRLQDGTTIAKDNIPPFYVIKKIPEKNQLVVGFGAETYSSSIEIGNLHLINDATPIHPDLQYLVRIRHTGKLIASTIEKNSQGGYTVHLSQPTQGIATGQSAVIYRNGVCLGGGIIEDPKPNL